VGPVDYSLYVILDRSFEPAVGPGDLAQEVIAGGATCLQVRLKNEGGRAFRDFTERVLAVARPAGIPVIVNDRLDVALALGADGVHVGAEDLPVLDARRLGGPDLVIGSSALSVEDAVRGAGEGADYIGVGPVFTTPVKPGVEPVGADVIPGIRRIISLPIVAIGGINEHNLHVPLAQGADGIAVISALHQCPSPGIATSRLRQALDRAKKR
jgi:thiamine-phosphate pyrophosphorylase